MVGAGVWCEENLGRRIEVGITKAPWLTLSLVRVELHCFCLPLYPQNVAVPGSPRPYSIHGLYEEPI